MAIEPIELSDGEKLILVMLCDLYKKLGVRGEVDPSLVLAAIFNGELWSLKFQYSGLFQAEETPSETVSEVSDLLDMWAFVETAYKRLSKADKTRIKREAEPYGEDVEYPGFDGNNETAHLGVAHTLVERLGRFPHFKGRGALNSHSHTLEIHRRMYAAFEPMRAGLGGRKMSADDIITLLKARASPSRRPVRS